MIKVGITGGIGSGKTTVCAVFKALNVPVYCADWEARRLTNSHPDIVSGVKELLGEDIYVKGQMNRKKVASLVFGDKQLLARLNHIIHPVVAQDFNNWVRRQAKHHAYVLKEAAILFESKGNQQMDQVITVTAPVDLRLRRVMKRDQMTKQEVMDRMKNQMPEEEKIRMSDYVIRCNDSDLVIPQVLAIHASLSRQ